MNTVRSSALVNSPAAGLVIGCVFFLSVFGYRILDPTYIDWQLSGDSGQHYLGWAFFRHEPWQLPIGKIAGFGTPDGSSVFYSDSIPLVAVFLKSIRGVLPEPFQYTGLWILACYLLQGMYGWRLSALATTHAYARALMTCLFVLAPCLLFRSDGHHALMAHWLLLAAIWLSVQRQDSFNMRHPRISWLTRWIVLLCLASVIHSYLWLMVAFAYIGALAANAWRGTVRGGKLMTALAVPALLLPVLLYLEGAFVVRSADWTTYIGVGYFSMNLLAPLVPGYWGSPDETSYVSYFLSSRGFATPGQYEGFNYLGLGVLFLLLISLVAGLIRAACNYRQPGLLGFLRSLKPSVAWPILASALLIAFLATSNTITLGRNTVLVVPLGKRLLEFCAIFRSSGRLFWLPGYLMLWMACHSYGRQLHHRYWLYASLLQAIVAIQVLDLSQFFKHFSHSSEKIEHYSSPLRSEFWVNHIGSYKDVLYYPPADTTYYIPLGLLAAPVGTRINNAYKARANNSVLSQATRQLSTDLRSGELRDSALYVFRDKGIFDNLKQKLTNGPYLFEEVDGLFVAARRAHGR